MLLQLCNRAKIDLTCENKFSLTRRWRFDYAVIEKKIAYEYEGGVWGSSRHRSPFGYMGDCEKYNNATYEGWRVYRFTVEDFNKKNYDNTKQFIKQTLDLDVLF